MSINHRVLASVLLFSIAGPAVGFGAALIPVPATGWNNDIIFGGGETGTGISGSMDNGPGFYGANWYGIGRNMAPGAETTGLPTELTASLSTPSDLYFQLQPFAGGPNAVLLNGGQSGILMLTTPEPFLRLALIGSTGNGTADDLITVNFADGTFETFSGGALNQDWFSNTNGLAFIANGRTSNNEGTTFDNVNNNQPRLYQEVFTLANTTNDVISISITNYGGGHSAIMAISGESIPEPTSLAMLGTAVGLLGLRRHRNRQTC